MFTNSLSKSSEISNKSFQGNSWSEISSPKSIRIISVREKIISFDRICCSFFLNWINISTRSWIFNSYSILWSAIYVCNQFINILVPHTRVSILEIFSKGMHKICCSKVISHRLEIINKVIGSDIDIVIFKGRIILNRLISTDIIKTESRRRAVVIVIDMSKNIAWSISRILQRPPNQLHCFFI